MTAQLIDATTGNHIWAERYDRELDDIFALQDEITETIVASVEPVRWKLNGLPKASQSAWISDQVRDRLWCSVRLSIARCIRFFDRPRAPAAC